LSYGAKVLTALKLEDITRLGKQSPKIVSAVSGRAAAGRRKYKRRRTNAKFKADPGGGGIML
jgi:hypothetical protein